ncbi:hypothetical protein M9458_011968, partial [Cirrhinus mrigala]
KKPEKNEASAEVNTDGQKNTEVNENSKQTLTSQLETEPVVKPEDSKEPFGATWGNEGGGHNCTQNKTLKDSKN